MAVDNIKSSVQQSVAQIKAQLGLNRFTPEPTSSISKTFKSLLAGASSAFSGTVSNVVSIDPAYAQLIEKQMEVQQQMQLVSLHSNIEKSKHETKMAAVRNVRTA